MTFRKKAKKKAFSTESIGVEERRQKILTLSREFLGLPRYSQNKIILSLIGQILALSGDALSQAENLAVIKTYNVLNESRDPIKQPHLLQIPERINWIIAEMTKTGPLKYYRSLFIENKDGNYPRSVQICEDFKHQIGSESEHLIPNLQDPRIQKRLLFGPREIPDGLERLRIKLFSSKIDNPITSELITEMQRVSNSRVIDRNIPEPKHQLGFGRKLTIKELEEAASASGAYLVVLANGEENFHFSMIHTEEGHFSSHASEIMQILYEKEEITSWNHHAWLEYIVTTKEGSNLLRSFGISSYGMSCYFTSILLTYANNDLLYCTCRSGEWANTAIQKSLRHGFEDTGIEISSENLEGYSQDPARVLRFDPYRLERVVNFVDKKASHDKGVHFNEIWADSLTI